MKQKLLTFALASVLIIGTVGAGLLLLPTSAPVSASVASGDSMGHSGQTVVVHADVGGYAVGDAVVFSADGHTIHHRIVDSTPDGYVTQGDAEPVTDQGPTGIRPVSESQIHGEALFVVPSGVALGGLLAAFVTLLGSAAWAYRPDAVRRVVSAGRSIPARQIATVVVVLLLVASTIPFGGLMISDGGGTVGAATSWELVDTYTGHSNSPLDVDASDSDYLYSTDFDANVHKLNKSDMSNEGTYTGHSGAVQSVILASDGYLYTASNDGEVHKVDPSTMSQVAVYTGHSDDVNAVVEGPNGYIYSAGHTNDPDVHKIDPSDMSNAGTYTGHSGSIQDLTVGDNGYIYSGSGDNEVHKIDISDMSQSGVYSGHSIGIDAVEYGDDGNLYSGSTGTENEMHKIDTSDMSQMSIYTGHSDDIISIHWAPDDYIYTGSVDTETHRINPSDLTMQDNYSASSGSVEAVSMGADGYLYLAESANNEIQKTDPKTSLGEQVSGNVTDADGNPLENATVDVVNSSTGSTAASVTTDANGYYETTVDAGTYDVTASHPDEPSVTKEVTVPEGGTTADFTLKKPDDGTYEQTFVLDDQTADQRFSDAGLTIQRETDSMGPGAIVTTEDWTTIDQTTFNHNDRAWSGLENGTYYRLKLTDDFSTWTYNGFHAIEDNGAFYLRPGRLENTTNETDYNVTSDNITVVSGDDGLVIEYDGEPVDSIDYNISDPETGEYVEGELDFEEPTDYYEGNFDDDILTNNTTGVPDYDEWEADYEGVYSNGTQFNGSVQATSLDGFSLDTRNGSDDDTGGFAAPAGGSSGGTPTWAIGIPAVAAIGYVVLRRRGGA